MMFSTTRRLVELLTPRARGETVAEVRIGLGYTAVRLAGGHAGVSWTPRLDHGGCTHLRAAGTLAGRPAAELLAMLADGGSDLARAVGLATANALLSAPPRPPAAREEIVSLLDVTPADRVVMVGFFAPLVPKLEKAGCRLDVVELNPDRHATLPPEKRGAALAECTVAVITATTIVNDTLGGILEALGAPRAAVLLGPSAPMCQEAFGGTKITHVAGARVRDPDAVLRIVSEGGGTGIMKAHLDFETLVLPGGTGQAS
jgi:hypothetical protein